DCGVERPAVAGRVASLLSRSARRSATWFNSRADCCWRRRSGSATFCSPSFFAVEASCTDDNICTLFKLTLFKLLFLITVLLFVTFVLFVVLLVMLLVMLLMTVFCCTRLTGGRT